MQIVLPKKLKDIFDFHFIVSFVVAWTLLLITLSKQFSEDNLIYAIGEISTYNPSLFRENIYMGNGVISPRYIIDFVFSALMHINGGSWADAALVWIYFGAFINSIAIANISYRVNHKNQIFFTAILSVLIIFCENFLANFRLVCLYSTSIGVALAFSFLAISFLFGEKRNYNLAWIFSALASICHIHEGMYCYVVIFLFAFVDCIIQKKVLLKENWAVFIAIFAVGLVTIPSILTDSMNISNSEFVQIYSNFRHPHHLVPSAWGLTAIFKTLWIDIFLFLLSLAAIVITNSAKIKFCLYESIALICAWIAAFCFMYLFTEVKPIAFVSTMFISKSFKYVLLIALIFIVKSAFELRERGDFVSSYLFIFFAFLAASFKLQEIFLLVVIIYLVLIIEDYFNLIGKHFVIAKAVPFIDIAFFVLLLCIKHSSIGAKNGFVIVLVFFAISAISFAATKKIKGYKPLCALACICMVSLSLLGRIVIRDNGSLILINGERALRASMGNDLYEIAENFNTKTDSSVEFLGDPDKESVSGWFQVVSERNCYVINKVIPSSKSTVAEWYRRYMQTTSFDEKNSDELKQIMTDENIKYILVEPNNYEKLEESADFTMFLISPSDLYRIYEIK